MEKAARWFFIIFTLVLTSYLVILLKIQSAEPISAKSESDSDSIPTLTVHLHNTTLEDLNTSDKTTRFTGNVVNITTKSDSYTYDNVELKLHGNSTLYQDKKPYQLKFSQKTSLFGLRKAKTWILLANDYDPTMLRNHLSAVISDSLGMPYAPYGIYIDLTVDDTDVGIYYLVPKITTSSLALHEDSAIIAEIDDLHEDTTEPYTLDTFGDFIKLSDTPADDSNTDTYFDIFMLKYNIARSYIREGNFDLASKYLDIESFAKYFLLSEITENVDSYVSSSFLYQASASDLIHAGPAWDFDLSMGNNFGDQDGAINSPVYLRFTSEDYTDSSIYRDLYRLPEFRELARNIYLEKSSIIKTSVKSALESTTNYLLNFSSDRKSFLESVKTLDVWLDSRFDFLDDFFSHSML